GSDAPDLAAARNGRYRNSAGPARKASRACRRQSSFRALRSKLARFAAAARACDLLNRIDDCLVAGAAAVISGQVPADLISGGNAAGAQQFLRAEQHARRAKPALQGVAADECLLQIGDLAAVGYAFDGFDADAVALHRQDEAAAHHSAIDAYRAGAAHAVLAASVAARQTDIVAQIIDQGLAHVDATADVLAIHGHRDFASALAHCGAPRTGRAIRRSRARTRETPRLWIGNDVGFILLPGSGSFALSPLPAGRQS